MAAPKSNRGRPRGSTATTAGHLLDDPPSGRRLAMLVFQERALMTIPSGRGNLAKAIKEVAERYELPPERIKHYVQIYRQDTQSLGEAMAHIMKANRRWNDRFTALGQTGADIEKRISGFMEHHKRALLDLPVSKVFRLLKHPSITPGAGAPPWLAECLNYKNDMASQEYIVQLESTAKQHR